MNLKDLSVGIIGGGIGGASAAAALTGLGAKATVYERAPEFREVGAGMMLWPNATRALRELNLLDSVQQCSGSSDHFLVRAEQGKILMDIALGDFDVPALCARRSDLLSVLIAAIPEGSIRLGHTFERLTRRKNGVTLHFADGSTAEHDVVIGADGIRSRVRAQLFDIQEPIYRGYMVWRGIATLKGAVPTGSNSETWGRGKRFGILHTGGDRYTWYATANTGPDHSDSQEGRKREILKMFEGWHEPVERILEATEDESILKNGAYDLPPLKKWGRGRVTLLGDSAHPCTPNLGLGGCMGIEDALVLAKSFSREATPEAALRRYETLRRQRTRHVQQRSQVMGNIGQWENPFIVGGRQLVTSLLPAKIFERNLRKVYSYAT